MTTPGEIPDLAQLRTTVELAIAGPSGPSITPTPAGPPPILYAPAPASALPGQPARFQLPRAGAQGPFFAVSRGLAVGIFNGW